MREAVDQFGEENGQLTIKVSQLKAENKTLKTHFDNISSTVLQQSQSMIKSISQMYECAFTAKALHRNDPSIFPQPICRFPTSFRDCFESVHYGDLRRIVTATNEINSTYSILRVCDNCSIRQLKFHLTNILNIEIHYLAWGSEVLKPELNLRAYDMPTDPLIFCFVPYGCLGLKLMFLNQKIVASIMENCGYKTSVILKVVEGDMPHGHLLPSCSCISCSVYRRVNPSHVTDEIFKTIIHPPLLLTNVKI